MSTGLTRLCRAHRAAPWRGPATRLGRCALATLLASFALVVTAQPSAAAHRDHHCKPASAEDHGNEHKKHVCPPPTPVATAVPVVPAAPPRAGPAIPAKTVTRPAAPATPQPRREATPTPVAPMAIGPPPTGQVAALTPAPVIAPPLSAAPVTAAVPANPGAAGLLPLLLAVLVISSLGLIAASRTR